MLSASTAFCGVPAGTLAVLSALLSRRAILASASRLTSTLNGAVRQPSRQQHVTASMPTATTAAAATSPFGVLALVQPRTQQQSSLAAAFAAGGMRTCHTAHAYAYNPTTPVRAFYHASPPPAAQQEQQQPQAYQPRADPRRFLQPPPALPVSAVAALGQRHGVHPADAHSFAVCISKLNPERQHLLTVNATAVAAHLQALGVSPSTVGRMLLHCPALFSYPVHDRIAPLMAELMAPARLGLGAAQAAEVFVRCPALGNTRNVMPTIVRLVVEQQGAAWGFDCGDAEAASA